MVSETCISLLSSTDAGSSGGVTPWLSLFDRIGRKLLFWLF